jgi:hypothetical protein
MIAGGWRRLARAFATRDGDDDESPALFSIINT